MTPLTGADLNRDAWTVHRPDSPQLISPHAAFTALRQGHPGESWIPTGITSVSNGVLLENERLSYGGAGFCLDMTADQPDGVVPGLVRVSESRCGDLAMPFRSESDQQ